MQISSKVSGAISSKNITEFVCNKPETSMSLRQILKYGLKCEMLKDD